MRATHLEVLELASVVHAVDVLARVLEVLVVARVAGEHQLFPELAPSASE